MQAGNVTRTAWLQAGLPLEAAATTVDTQCGSSQQATNIATALVAAGVVDVAVACGVEVMSEVPMGATVPKDPFVGKPINRNYWEHYENTSQFEGAERIAEKFGVTRDELDAFGKQSQDRAAAAWAEGRFDTQIVPIEAPTRDDDGEPNGTQTITRDEGLRETTLEALANLKPVLDRDPAFHTAGTASQISDGAGALLLMTAEKADALGLAAQGAHRRHVHRGQRPGAHAHRPDPGHRAPARAQQADRSTTSTSSRSTRRSRRWCSAWQRATGADLARVNPNGGAIALGHPLGGTGAILLTKAMHELERVRQARARSSPCAAVAASAPAPSSNASESRRRLHQAASDEGPRLA